MMNTVLHGARPDELVAAFLGELRETGDYRRELVARLVALAASPDPEVAKMATTAFFTSLVERLADSFSPADVSLYNRVFAQTIDYCRHLDQGRVIDVALSSYGLRDEADLLARAESLRRQRPAAGWRGAKDKRRRIVVLSRVTLGADVAITSVVIGRLEREFPNAEIVLVGGRKAAELFGGDARIQFREIDYRRGGATIERLLTWLDVIAATEALTSGLSPGEWLIVDPDSRLTQLGLLPLSKREENYLFFPSREYGAATSLALAELASNWMDEVFGAAPPSWPGLRLLENDRAAAGALTERVRQAAARPIVTVNFGVGENPAKRIGDEFEQSLVVRLIQSGVTVILDKGAGADETRRADAVIARARRVASARVAELTERNFAEMLNGEAMAAELLVWDGRIGRLAALIARSDLYIGYDSAGQHIAAAAGTPCVDVFAGYSSPRMLDRWRPTGRAASRVIAVDSSHPHAADAILSAALAEAKQRLEAGG